MPRFLYKAVRSDGEALAGECEAVDEQAVVTRLQGEGVIPLQVVPATGARSLLSLGRSGRSGRLRQEEVMALTQELATLLEAGLTLDRSLRVLHDLSRNERLKSLLASVREHIQSGSTFADALEAQNETFSRLYVNMVRAGEAGGVLEKVLARLSDYLERSAELKDSIRSALIYPTILLTVAGLSVILLLVFVVPQFSQMFSDMGQTLPLATRIVIAAGDLFRDYWWAMLALIALTAALLQWQFEKPAVRQRWDKRLLSIPLLGDLVAKVETARFTRTLSTLLENGLPVLSALNLVKNVISNTAIRESIDAASQELKRGKGLAEPLIREGILPDLALQMIKVGEESGHLDRMLLRVADVYDREVRSSVKRMLTLLEPVLIVGLGVVVAGIIVSILVAILQANQLVF